MDADSACMSRPKNIVCTYLISTNREKKRKKTKKTTTIKNIIYWGKQGCTEVSAAPSGGQCYVQRLRTCSLFLMPPR